MCSQMRQNGFTLAEVLIATLLVGLSVYALLAANGAFSMVNGAGAAAIACMELFEAMGFTKKNVILCDSRGVVYSWGDGSRGALGHAEGAASATGSWPGAPFTITKSLS